MKSVATTVNGQKGASAKGARPLTLRALPKKGAVKVSGHGNALHRPQGHAQAHLQTCENKGVWPPLGCGGAVEVVRRGAGEVGDDRRGDTGAGARLDQSADGFDGGRVEAAGLRGAADDEHDLALAAPRTRSARESDAVPRTISSWSFVSSRQTATGRSGSSSASTANDAPTRRGDSNATTVSGDAKTASTRLRGRKPANRHTSDGSALATSAVIAEDGPGRTSTASPAATQPCTSA